MPDYYSCTYGGRSGRKPLRKSSSYLISPWSRRLPVLVLLLLTLVACKDDSIRKAARAADDMAVTIGLAIDTKRELAAAGLLPPEQELPLTLGIQKVNTSVKAFHLQVKNTKELDPTSKDLLLRLFAEITAGVAELNHQGVLEIKNPEAKTKVSAVLAGFQVSFVVIQAVLEGDGS